MIKEYYRLTKPGIIYGNAITFAGGFFFAANGAADFFIFFTTLFGLSLIIASSCVLNNYIDRDIDQLMERTKHRALPSGTIALSHAINFALCLGVLGVIVLYFFTNLFAFFVALLGVFFYVVVYSLWTKRQSVYGTLVGSISGATPPVIGYIAVTETFDMAALLLFIILVLWQMPHFYAIAVYRLRDYAAAGIPVLPVKEGIYRTKIHMLVYISLFVIAGTLLGVLQYRGPTYLALMSIFGLVWLLLCIRGFWLNTERENGEWARGVFIFSIVIITTFSFLIGVG